jgi:hypothetical protein
VVYLDVSKLIKVSTEHRDRILELHRHWAKHDVDRVGNVLDLLALVGSLPVIGRAFVAAHTFSRLSTSHKSVEID